MATYQLTTGKDHIGGSAGADLFEAFYDPENPASTLTSVDTVNGGSGTDTLAVAGTYDGINGALQGTITSIETLALIGEFDNDSDDGGVPMDASKVGGLQTVLLQDGSAYGLPTNGDNETDVWLSNLAAGQSTIVDNVIGFAVLDYKVGVTSALLGLAENGYVAAFELAGQSLSNIVIDSKADHDTLVNLAPDPNSAVAANPTTLTIDAEKGRVVVANGFLAPFIGAIENANVPPEDQGEVDGPPGFAGFKTVTVTGTGGGWVDLTADTADVTFTGSAGDDAVLVDPANTNTLDHFDGGGGTDIFAIDLLNTPASQGSLTLSTAAYAAITAAKHFEEVGIIGDFERTIVVNAAKLIAYKTIVIGQTTRFANLSDDQTVLYQITGFDNIHTIHLTLDHRLDSKGHMLGQGVVTVKGGDVLETGALFGKLFGEDYAPPSGLAVFDSASLYASLTLTGTFDADVRKAATWTDAAGAVHGVTIDASGLAGKLKVEAGTALADTIKGSVNNDTIDGGLGSDILTGGGGKDRFVFDTALSNSNVDTITDFDVKNDHILLNHTVFSALTKGVTPDFAIGHASTGANDHLFYDSASGFLFYSDTGGATAAQAHEVAQLGTGLALKASNFLVI